MPKISVIIPIYNVEKYLRHCLDSVLNQTFQDFEVICVNDGSPDKCADILAEYEQRDSRIKVITQENQGVSVARNTAIQNATGEYISFLDSYDEFAPTFLEKMYNAITTTNADMVWCDYQRGTEKRPWQITHNQIKIYSHPFDTFILQKPNMQMAIWNKLWRKELVLPHPFISGLVHWEDVVFLHQALYQTKQVAYLPETLIFYRKREGSAVHSSFCQKVVDNNILTVKILCEHFATKPMNNQIHRILHTKLAKRLFKFCVLEPKRKDKDNLEKWYAYTRSLLAELKQNGIYQPQYLTLKNRIKSWLFLKGKKNG